MQKLKDIENVCEWPEKHENCECFLLLEFPVIQYYNPTVASVRIKDLAKIEGS